MAFRVRKNGEIVCAAVSDAESGDLYFDDRLHEYLTGASGLIAFDDAPLVAAANHKANGRWHWRGSGQ